MGETSLPDRGEGTRSTPVSPLATPEQRMFEFGLARYEQRLAAVVRNLHDLAETIEREARVREARDVMGTPALIWSAQTVVHRVMWGLANLNLDGLVNIAGDTEAARVQRDEAAERCDAEASSASHAKAGQ